jgi:ribosomal protein S27AE
MTYRFCMACGGRLRRVRQEGRLRLSCGRCGWTFYGNPVPAAVALVVRNGKVLSFFSETYGRRGFPILAAVYRVSLASRHLRHGSDVSAVRWFSRRALPYREIRFPSVRRALRRSA